MHSNLPNSFVNLFTGSTTTEGAPTNPSFQMHPNFMDLTTFPPYPTFQTMPIFQNMSTPYAVEMHQTQNFQTYAAVQPFYQTPLTRMLSYQLFFQNLSNPSEASNSTPSSSQTPISTPATIESTTENANTTEESNTLANHQPTKSRNAYWSKVEDASLISAYVNTCNDPIIGADQTKNGFWNKIEEHYKQYAPSNARVRNKKQIHARWQRCIVPTQKFAGNVDEITRLHPSGMNEDDLINKAHALYEERQGKKFQFEHWWRALRYWPKWQSFSTPSAGASKRIKVNELGRHSESSTQGSEEQSIDLNIAGIELTRPIGRKVAKRKEKEKAVVSSVQQKILELKERQTKAKEKKVEAIMRLQIQLKDYNEMKIMSQETSKMPLEEAEYWNETKAAIIRRVKVGKQTT